jgi:NAD(P)-dependent dehydrogenase (short-subunit alcohol dehydrogenase family)
MAFLPSTPRQRSQRRLGLTDDELATVETVYRDGVLDGHVMLIPGGGTGIGKATAYLAARLGAQVMICGRREAMLRETAAGIEQRLGKTIGWKVTNIRDPDQVTALVADTWEQFGRLDTLVNSAGGQFIQPSMDYSVKGWLAVVDTNLNGHWWLMQACGRRWRDSGLPGNIVNIISVVDRGLPSVVHTAAARGGVITLSKSIAVEWAPYGIRVNCVAPGAILSDGIGNYTEEHQRRLPNGNPMRRMGDTMDMAQAIIYLSAPSGKYVTGEVLRIDGGSQLWSGGAPDEELPEWFRANRTE